MSGQLTKVKTLVDGLTPDETKYKALNLQTVSTFNYLETEPDGFTFNFMGNAGKFILDHNQVPRLISNQPLEFSFSTSAYGPELKQMITSWSVIDGSGITYEFGAFESSYANENALYYFPNTWYLTQVTDTKGNKISIEYTVKDPNKARVQTGVIDQVVQGSSQNLNFSNFFTNFSLEVYPTKVVGSLWEIELISSELITFVGAGENSTHRKLDAIKVYDTSLSPKSLSRQFDFNYLDVNTYKLTLASVGELGLPPHTFEYFNPIPVGVNGTSRSVDEWGYFNNWNNPLLIKGTPGVNLEPNLSTTRYGALQKITYPTGGYTELAYELNDYSYQQSQATSKTILSYVNYSFHFFNIIGNTQQHPTSAFTFNQNTNVEIRFSANSTSPSSCQNLSYPFNNGWQSFTLAPGSYSGNDLLKLPEFSPCNDVFGPCSEPFDPCVFAPPGGYDVTLDVRIQQQTTVNRPKHGGIRVSKVIETPKNGQSDMPFETSYFYSDFANANLSSGAIIQEPEYSLTIPANLTAAPIGQLQIKRSNAFNPVSMSPVTYKHIRDLTGKGETFRYFTAFEYSDISGRFALVVDFQDAPADGINDGIKNFSSFPNQSLGDFESRSFMRGLPKKTEVYSKNGDLKTSQEYTYLSNGSVSNLAASFYHEKLFSYSYNAPSMGGFEQRDNSFYYGKAFNIQGGWPRKVTEVLKNYETNSLNPIVTTISYDYGNESHAQLSKKRTGHSDGSVIEENFKYPLDYTAVSGKATFLQEMEDAHMWVQPIEYSKTWDKGALDKQVLAANATTYKSVTGNSNKASLILPYKIFTFSSDGNSPFVNYAGTSTETASPSYYEKANFTNYDHYGNLLHLNLLSGTRTLSYLWAYKSRFPVASLEATSFNELTTGLTTAGSSIVDIGNRVVNSEIDGIMASLRTHLPNKLISHFLYKPNFGLISNADPSSKIASFAYDSNGRLIETRDNQGVITNRWIYKYAMGSSSSSSAIMNGKIIGIDN